MTGKGTAFFLLFGLLILLSVSALFYRSIILEDFVLMDNASEGEE